MNSWRKRSTLSPVPEIRPSKARVEALLADLAPLPVRARAMFGGYGLYYEDVFFGLVSSGGGIYFRTDDGSRPDYLAAGMSAFQPGDRPVGPKTMPRNFEVPPAVIRKPSLLRRWAERAARADRLISREDIRSDRSP